MRILIPFAPNGFSMTPFRNDGLPAWPRPVVIISVHPPPSPVVPVGKKSHDPPAYASCRRLSSSVTSTSAIDLLVQDAEAEKLKRT